MADSRHRRKIVDQTVVAGVALLDQPLEALVTKLVIIPAEVVPAHLVYHHTDYELRALAKLSFCLCTYRAAEQQKQTKPFHAAKIQLFTQSSKYLRDKNRQVAQSVNRGLSRVSDRTLYPFP
jgi:hypothetical protein